MRCAATISYNGTNFYGSQEQKETPNTILGQLISTLKQLGIDSKVVASGRTDRGVHATAQVCHFNLPHFWNNLEKLKANLNRMLPNSIRIKRIIQVDDSFHARYSAKKRVYRYIIKEGEVNPFSNDFVTFIAKLDIDNIQNNIRLFVGEHNFEYFMKTGSETNSTVRTIYKALLYEYKGYIILKFEANGFLRSQIRMMVGALLQLNSSEINEQLERTKKHKIKPAPSNGLYLAKIKY